METFVFVKGFIVSVQPKLTVFLVLSYIYAFSLRNFIRHQTKFNTILKSIKYRYTHMVYIRRVKCILSYIHRYFTKM